MANNKVIYGNTPLIDLTTDTATAENVVYGTSFMGSNGQMQTGTMQASGATVIGANISIAGKTYQPPSWATGTPEEIADFLDWHYSGRFCLQGFWNDGDERAIPLSDGKTVTYVIKYGGLPLVNSIEGTSISAFTIEPKYITHSHIYGNYVSARITWARSSMKSYVNGDFYNSFPADFRALLKQFVSPQSTNDYFYVPDYNRGKMTNPSGVAQQYWLSSYPSSYPAEDYYVNTSGGTQSAGVSNSKGVYAIGAI